MARVLVAARLSRASDRSTSIERQHEQGDLWARMNGHTVTARTTDSDVSGAVSPFEREDLGPWLTDPARISEWDILLVAKLDRLTRSMADFVALTQWAERHGKVIVSIAESLDLGTAAGRMVAGILALFAQFERERIGERHCEAQAKSRELGRWRGVAPYGYRAEQQGQAYRLVQSDEAATVRRMIGMALQGASYGQIARELDTTSVKPRVNGKWGVSSVRAVLTSVTLLGWRKHDGKVNRDADGEPIMYTDAPIIDDRESFEDLQRALESRSKPAGERIGGHLLLRVAFCRACKDQPLYAQYNNGRGYGYYRCTRCKYRIRMDRLETRVVKLMLGTVGERELRRKRVVQGDDHAKQIGRLERDIETLRSVAGTESLIDAKQAEIEALKALPHEPDRIVWEGTGQTVAAYWDSLDREARGHFLREWGVTCHTDAERVRVRLGWLDPDSEALDVA